MPWLGATSSHGASLLADQLIEPPPLLAKVNGRMVFVPTIACSHDEWRRIDQQVRWMGDTLTGNLQVRAGGRARADIFSHDQMETWSPGLDR